MHGGCGGPYVFAGHTGLHGARPVNTSGGLKAKGHPVGATGVAQICDLVLQIRGEAGAREKDGARGRTAERGGRVVRVAERTRSQIARTVRELAECDAGRADSP